MPRLAILHASCFADKRGICVRTPGAEFLTAMLFTSTIGFPVLFYAEGIITPKALGLSLGGVALALSFIGTCAFLHARADDDAFHRW